MDSAGGVSLVNRFSSTIYFNKLVLDVELSGTLTFA